MGNLVLDASTPATVYSATKPVTTASFTPPANSLLVVATACNTATATTTGPPVMSNSGTALTFTQAQHSQRSDGSPTCDRCATIFTAPVLVSAAMTVSATSAATGVAQAAMKVWVVTDDSGQLPTVGTSSKGAQNTGNAANQAFTATAANSWGFGVVDDWDAAGVPTAGTGTTITAGDAADQGAIVAYAFARRTTPDGSVGVSTSINVTLPVASANLGKVAVEIVPAVSAAVLPILVMSPPGRH